MMIIKGISKIIITYLQGIILVFAGTLSSKLHSYLLDRFTSSKEEFAEIEINREVRITINDKYMDIYVKSIKCRELSKPTTKDKSEC